MAINFSSTTWVQRPGTVGWKRHLASTVPWRTLSTRARTSLSLLTLALKRFRLPFPPWTAPSCVAERFCAKPPSPTGKVGVDAVEVIFTLINCLTKLSFLVITEWVRSYLPNPADSGKKILKLQPHTTDCWSEPDTSLITVSESVNLPCLTVPPSLFSPIKRFGESDTKYQDRIRITLCVDEA